MAAQKKNRNNGLGKNERPAKKASKPGKPYQTTYSETYVEPIGMGPIKEK